MQAGKPFGLSFLLNPALDEYFCTSSYSKGFRVIDIGTETININIWYLYKTQTFVLTDVDTPANGLESGDGFRN